MFTNSHFVHIPSTPTRPADARRRAADDQQDDPSDRRPAWVRRLEDRIVVAPDLPSSIRVGRPLR